jgi:hypothetical protein
MRRVGVLLLMTLAKNSHGSDFSVIISISSVLFSHCISKWYYLLVLIALFIHHHCQDRNHHRPLHSPWLLSI